MGFVQVVNARNFGYDVTYVRPYRLTGWRWGGRRASGDGSVWAIFLLGNRVAALHLATHFLLAGSSY